MLTRRFKIILIICIACLAYGLWPMAYGLVYGQDNYLRVKGRTKANALRFAGNLSDYPATPVEGELFYHQGLGYLRYFGGGSWRDFGSGPKMVASVLVAAADSANRGAADFICDGTNDQVEIQQAINALGTIGGAVYLLEGTYNISAAINLDSTAPVDSAKSIIGAGRGTILKVTVNSINVISASSVEGILISQLTIDGTGSSSTSGIVLGVATRSKIDNIWLQNISVGVAFLSSSVNSLTNSHFTNSRVLISQNQGGGGPSTNNIVSGNVLRDGGTTALMLIDYGSNNIISHNTVLNGSAAGIRVNWGSNNIISGNNVQSNAAEGILLASTGASAYSSFSLVSGNNIRGNAREGIRLGLADPAWPGSQDNLIASNYIADNGGSLDYCGINLEKADRNLIFANRITDTAGTGYGIGINFLGSTCSDNYLVGNFINGSGYSGRLIRDSGTSTRYTDKLKLTSEKVEVNTNNYNNFYYLDEVDGYSRFHFTTRAATYVAFNIDTFLGLPLEDGRSPGDLLILENVNPDASKYLRICDSSSGICNPDSDNCDLAGGDKFLYRYDTLKLIWNGAKWLQIGYVDNQP